MARTRLKVKPGQFEKMLVFKVESRSRPDQEHTVDISAHKGYGQCSCKNWDCKVWPVVRDQTARRLTKAATCAHVRAVLGYILRKTHRSLIEQHATEELWDDEC